MTQENGPGGCATDPALDKSVQCKLYRANGDEQPFCELHHHNIVDEFPSCCPLATTNPLVKIERLQDAAWKEIRRPWSDPDRDSESANELLDQLKICGGCIDRNLSHRTIRRLRRELGVRA